MVSSKWENKAKDASFYCFSNVPELSFKGLIPKAEIFWEWNLT